MDERSVPAQLAEHLPPQASGLENPTILQILSTEHWSLLSARSLVYNEAFARAGMFLTFLSASLVALAFAAGAMAFSREFIILAIALLGSDLLIGLATLGRIFDTVLADLTTLQGMNRIRNGYVQIAPQVLPYLSGGIHDDAAGVLGVYGATEASVQSVRRSIRHGMTTTSSMVSVIVALISGAIAALVVVLLGLPTPVAFAAAFVGVAIVFALETRYATHMIARFAAEIEARFPTPASAGRARPE